jgi:hydroxyacylglutathione hydrolase
MPQAVPLLGAPVVLAVISGYMYFRNYNKASILYLLYARTPIGRFYHNAAIKAARQKKQETLATGQERTMSKQLSSAYTYESARALVRIVPFLSDNYAYILVCKATHQVAVVDPADAEVVAQSVQDLQVELGSQKPLRVTTVLTTHYHSDHAGGNKDFVKRITDVFQNTKIEVVGGANESWPGVQAATRFVKHGDQLRVGDLTITCLDVPCHTWGSVLFLTENLCFTGDYLFSAGCGRFFEGGAKDFCSSLAKSVNSLGDDVMMFPGHEYTVSNLKFATKVLPDDETIKRRLEQAIETRKAGDPTVPSSMGDERQINIFLRAGDSKLYSADLVMQVKQLVASAPLTVSSGADKHDPSTFTVKIEDDRDVVQIVRAIRALKDRG